MTRFLVVPQWQGSPAARAMLLAAGAEAIAGDLPRARTTTIDVPLEAGESLGTGVQRLSALHRTAALVTDHLASEVEPVIVIGGDCGVAVPAIAHAAARHARLAVVWFDAHGDLQTPATSPSGAFAGMALRAVLGDGELALAPGTVPATSVVLAGSREWDDAETEFIGASGVQTVSAADLANPDALADAVAATGADAVFIHVDLDVLDPAGMTGIAFSVPFGIEAPELVAAIAAVRARVPLAGASIAGFAPATPAAAVDDMATILRVIGALA